MRLPLLLLMITAAPAALHAQKSSTVFDFPKAGLSVELPVGFALVQTMDKNLPDFAGFSFRDDQDPPHPRLLHVTVPTYFSEE